MGQPVIQTSFNTGEWTPALFARVDLAKYHSGAALLRNFFVDHRGGAASRPGTKYILQTKSTSAVRLIPFQASFIVSYILEFGDGYVRFYNNGAPVLESAKTITGITKANPAVVSSTAHGYANGDWVFISNVGGMSQVNGNFYIVAGATANTYQLNDLNGALVNSTAYTTYTSSGQSQRVYTITSPYTASELSRLKFAQNVNTMVICHPNHPPYQLVLTTATSWTLSAINFGSTISPPAGISMATTLAAGSVSYAYVVTSVDSSGQESAPSAYGTLGSIQDIRSVLGTNTVSWLSAIGAVSYNVYRAVPSYAGAVPGGSAFGFIGNVTGLSLIDSNITPDFSQGPPIVQNPFSGTGVASVTMTNVGAYQSGEQISFVSFSGGGGSGAIAYAQATVTSIGISNPGFGYAIGDILGVYAGIVIRITSVGGSGNILAIAIVNAGSLTSGQFTGGNPSGYTTNSGTGINATFNITWGITSVGVTTPGTGYSTPPAVIFTTGSSIVATAVSVLGTASSGNPTVPGFFQQRLVLAGPVSSPQQFNMSQPGAPYNFNVTIPAAGDNAIQGTLVSGQLNTIQSMITQPQGLIILSDKQAWLINGGSAGSPISALQIVANSQAYNGASYPPPIVANDNILYVQAKGSIIRDLTFNFYTAIYTGADISVLSSHLFYGYSILEWAWAEEPLKIAWAVRNDGTLLSLTFLKEQELIAWGHSDTQGAFKSIATVTETVATGTVDAIYTVVQRTINGNVVQYIERLTELPASGNLTDAWAVDAGLQYNGTSVLTFSGAQHLANATVTGLATDNLGNVTVITPFTMPTNGTFTLAAPASPATGYTRVTVGLSFLPQLQTLPLDLGEPTVQGKRKKIAGVTLKVKDTLGLSMGRTADTALPLQDLIIGNVGSMTNQLVTNLVTGDVRGYSDPLWDVPGQYFIQQTNPYPAFVLGVVPEIEIGDTQK